MNARAWCGVAAAAVLAGCPPVEEPREWQTIASDLPQALMAVSGSSTSDVWAVGADTGDGPLALHFDGTTWERRPTGVRGPLWWVHTFADGTSFMGGARGIVLEWDGQRFTRHETPALARQTVFGVWGSSRSDVYAVGSGTSGRRGFIWHYDGTVWSEVALPADIPLRLGETPGLFKVWGRSENDVFVVGGDGLVLHKDAIGWKRVSVERTDTLFTVHGSESKVYLCGGGASAELLEGDGTSFSDVSPPDVALVQGVYADPTNPERAIAVGEQGAVFERGDAGWTQVAHGLSLNVESLHAAWVDPEGGVWAVGGRVLSDLTKGALIRLAPKNAATFVPPAPVDPPVASCPAAMIDPAPTQSLARRWNEQALGAIRRDLPRPTVHARTLFHLSAAMWDVWAAFDQSATPLFSTERSTATGEVTAERAEALSYAAYRVLNHRYAKAVGGDMSHACFDAFMQKLGYDPADVTVDGASARALGNRIGFAIISAHVDDGSNEANNYADTTGFMSMSPALPVESPSAPVDDLDHWQPLDLAIAATQNGIPLAAGVQKYIGAHWGQVKPFALTRMADQALYVDPGPAPKLDASTMRWVVDILQKSAALEPNEAEMIDVSPGAYGNNPLGSNAGTGHPLNPFTNQPYAPLVVPRGDFGRVLAEYWADGPKSETPPGHWNLVANRAMEHPLFVRQWQGRGEVLEPLAYDVRLYLVLNGALHDAAIAAWEIKRAFVSSRPITLIRSCAGRGQSSDPSRPAYDARGLPLIDGLIELVTAESAAPGQRHEGLRNAVGQVAIKSWRGEAGDVSRVSGIGWLRGVEWVPYQKRDFVTPAFPGFVSGHSTFSRAAAEVLTRATGSAFFPGGLYDEPIRANTALTFERGPSRAISLQWATYFDAADQAGQSRLWGGIHIEPDDFQGRKVGAQVGSLAFTRAERLFPGP